MEVKSLFGWLFIIYGIAIFFLPDHPKLLNCLIIVTYIICMFWWARWGYYWDSAYWVAAASITFVVTFGFLRH